MKRQTRRTTSTAATASPTSDGLDVARGIPLQVNDTRARASLARPNGHTEPVFPARRPQVEVRVV